MTPRRGWAWAVLTVVGAFYLLPMLALARFALQRVPVARLGWTTALDGWSLGPVWAGLSNPRFLDALWLSGRISVVTVVLGTLLMVPTTVLVHLHLRHLRDVVETMTILPYVVPPIALVVGAARVMRETAPWFLASPYSLAPFYVLLAMPFTFRSIDASLRSIDLRTIVEASRTLGANWTTTVLRVIVPNVLPGVLGAAFLTVAVVFGEFTVASLLLKYTVPLYLSESRGADVQATFAIGLLLMIGTTLVFALVNRLSRGVGRVSTVAG